MLARFVSFVFFASALAIPAQQLVQGNSSSSKYESEQQTDINDFSVTRLEELIETGPVFVNFTASWCITCKVNERVVLSGDDFRDALEARGVTYMKADWTRRDPEVTHLIEEFGRAGVPLYVYFPAGADPVVLPQLLSDDTLRAAFAS